jgi:hypothetical protein
MIVRIIVVDPKPQLGRSDLLVYQVPERSREFAVLTELIGRAGLEWAVVPSTRRKAGKRKSTIGGSKL